jgi:pSer/pThr/pTyr-binding forkhead associated (FHA) protein
LAGLDRFEQFFEGIVEGTIMRFFRSPIQPAEIGRKLERAMEDGRVASVGGPIVPNDYRVEMHPQDMVTFADFVLPLSRQMEGWLAEEIAERGYQTLGRVIVQISANDRVRRRTIGVAATANNGAPPSIHDSDRLQRTELYRVMREQSGGLAPQTLRMLNGAGKDRVFTIRAAVTTIGRGLENDLVLDSTDVSRNHARIEYRDGQWFLIDLNSTNGTRLNGQPVRQSAIRGGDQFEVGSIMLEFSPYQVGATPGGYP